MASLYVTVVFTGAPVIVKASSLLSASAELLVLPFLAVCRRVCPSYRPNNIVFMHLCMNIPSNLSHHGFASGCVVSDLQSGGCGFESQPGLLLTKVYSAFHPSGVGKWVPAIAGKEKAGMAHSDCGRTCECAGKTAKSLVNTCHTWALLRWWFTTKRRYISSVCTFFTIC